MMQSRKWRETKRGLHEPLIDDRTFADVQRILDGKKPVSSPYKRNRAEFPLRRFLRCSRCGTPLTGGGSRSATGKTYNYYCCYKCHAVKSLSAEHAAAEFVALLECLRPSSALVTEFPAILKEEREKRTGGSGGLLRKLRADLRDKESLRQKLVEAYLNKEKGISSVFEQMNAKFEEQITTLQAQIAEAEMTKATFEELLHFSESLLVDISTAWQRADLDQKQRVQNVLFPAGLKYDPEKGILNSENECLFNQLKDFTSGKMLLARPERFELPTYRFGGSRLIVRGVTDISPISA